MAQPRFIFLLNSSQRRVQQWIAAQGEEGIQLSAPQAAVLFLLERQDGQLMGELAQRLDLVPSAVSGLVDRCQKLGLLERRACTVDGRAQRVWLTEQGRAQLPRLHQVTRQAQEKFSKGFSSEELAVVERWLNQVRREFNEKRAEDDAN